MNCTQCSRRCNWICAARVAPPENCGVPSGHQQQPHPLNTTNNLSDVAATKPSAAQSRQTDGVRRDSLPTHTRAHTSNSLLDHISPNVDLPVLVPWSYTNWTLWAPIAVTASVMAASPASDPSCSERTQSSACSFQCSAGGGYLARALVAAGTGQKPCPQRCSGLVAEAPSDAPASNCRSTLPAQRRLQPAHRRGWGGCSGSQ